MATKLTTRHDLIQQIFSSINDVKRAKVLARQARFDEDYAAMNYHYVNEHEAFLSLELSVRTLNKELRDTDQLEVPLSVKDRD